DLPARGAKIDADEFAVKARDHVGFEQNVLAGQFAGFDFHHAADEDDFVDARGSGDDRQAGVEISRAGPLGQLFGAHQPQRAAAAGAGVDVVDSVFADDKLAAALAFRV